MAVVPHAGRNSNPAADLHWEDSSCTALFVLCQFFVPLCLRVRMIIRPLRRRMPIDNLRYAAADATVLDEAAPAVGHSIVWFLIRTA